MPELQYTRFLLLLLLIPLLTGIFILAVYGKKSAAKKIGDPLLVKQLLTGYNARAYFQKFVILLLSFTFLVIVLANPRKAISEEKISRDGIDVLFAIDVSKSMLAQDIKPSRLDRAKQVLNRLIDKLDNDRIGIVIFAGKAYLQMPLTSDHSAAKMYLSAANTESVPTQGTVIGEALRICNNSFNNKEKKYKAIVLITDGEDHDKTALKVTEELAASGVAIYTVGIGSSQGAPLIDETTNEVKIDNEGNAVVTKLNESILKQIAQKANGAYFLFNNTDAVISGIQHEINSMDQRGVKDDSLMNYSSYFQYFLALAFILLIWELFISENKKRKKAISNLKPGLAVLCMVVALPAMAQQHPENANIKKGNEAYSKGNYKKATEYYEKALTINPNSPVAKFNLGNAKCRSGNNEEAISFYEAAFKVMDNPVDKSNALYNKAVIYQRGNKLEECIDAYKKALRLDPLNEDARQNLQRALQLQKKQQQQKENKKKEQQQQKQQKQEPKQQPSKLTKEDAENKLKALSQQEKNLQDKLHKVNEVSTNKPAKDW